VKVVKNNKHVGVSLAKVPTMPKAKKAKEKRSHIAASGNPLLKASKNRLFKKWKGYT